ncbi:MAG: hypothetical protein FJ264_10695 [Planctomycetes bacterium]|nr:hypothetical protein [Planctomycetota bacterium]
MRLKLSDKEPLLQNKFLPIINKNPNPVLQVTKDGAILFANKAGLWFLNFWNRHVTEHVPAQWNKIIADCFNDDSNKTVEAEYENSVFSLTFVPVTEEGFINIYIVDITEQKYLKEKVTQLERLNILSTMSSEIAHEINTPIGAFSLCAQESMKYCNKISIAFNHLETQVDAIAANIYELYALAGKNGGNTIHSQIQEKLTQSVNNLDSCENELKKELRALKNSESHLREYLGNSIRESINCKEAVNNLLNFANQIVLCKKNYNINCLITDAIVSIYRMFNENKIDIVFNLADNLPHVLIDICKMELVLVNIFYNTIYAIKALTKDHALSGNNNNINGTITIETSMGKNKDEIEILIKDTGACIHKNNVKKIFTPFFTQNMEKERPIIGLGIASKIIRMHHGTIDVESEKETGTTFRISLPLKEKRCDSEML